MAVDSITTANEYARQLLVDRNQQAARSRLDPAAVEAQQAQVEAARGQTAQLQVQPQAQDQQQAQQLNQPAALRGQPVFSREPQGALNFATLQADQQNNGTLQNDLARVAGPAAYQQVQRADVDQAAGQQQAQRFAPLLAQNAANLGIDRINLSIAARTQEPAVSQLEGVGATTA